LVKLLPKAYLDYEPSFTTLSINFIYHGIQVLCDVMDNNVNNVKKMETHEKWVVFLAVVGWAVFIGFMIGIKIF